MTLPELDNQLYCDTSTKRIQPFVPVAFRRLTFEKFHNLAHPGIRSTVHLITNRFFWPLMKSDIKVWTRACIPCQRAKIHWHTKTPTIHIPVDNSRFSHIQLDLIGSLPNSQGCTHCLTMIDRFTRWTEAKPLNNIEAATVTQAFYKTWITRFGAPNKIMTD